MEAGIRHESIPRDARKDDTLAEALRRAACGWAVIPVNAVTKAPLTANGVRDATRDPDTLKRWWTRYPNAGLAVALAPAGLLVLDADSPEAVEEARELLQGVRCPTARTPRGGVHFFLRSEGLPRVRRVRRGRSQRLDVLGDGYAVVPPGPGRAWVVSPDDVAPPPPPPAVVELLREAPSRGTPEGLPPMPDDLEALAEEALTGLPAWFRADWGTAPDDDRSGYSFRLARRAVELGVADEVALAAIVVTCAAHRDKFSRRPDAWEDAVRVVRRALEAGGAPEVVVKTTNGDKDTETCFHLIHLAEVQPRETEHLWRPYAPLGELTLCDGDSGEGKSWIALWLAARVSRGEPPVEGGPGEVLLLTVEDDLERVVVPRLIALGADLRRIHLVTAGDAELGVTLSQVMAAAPLIRELRPRLLIIDTISEAFDVPGERAVNTAPAVRRALRPLREVVRELNCAAWLTRHFAKAARTAKHRGLGSVDFVAVARSLLVVGPVNGLRVMAHAKNNVGPLGPSLAFEIEEGATPPFRWTGEVSVKADEVAAPPQAPEIEVVDPVERSKVEEAEEALSQILKPGPVRADEALQQVRGLCISERTIREAKARLGVRSKRIGSEWYWELKVDGA